MSAIVTAPPPLPASGDVRGTAPASRPFRRRLVVNSLATTAGNLWSIVVSAIALPLTLHGLGVEAFGVWALVQTFSAFTGWLALADVGVGTAATRSLAMRASVGDMTAAGRLQSATVGWFAATGVCAAGAFGAFGWLAMSAAFHVPLTLRSDVRFVALLFAGQILVDFVVRGMQFCLEGYNRVDLARMTEAIRRTLSVGGIALAATAGWGLRGVAIASFIGALSPVLLCVLLLRRAGGRFGRADRASLTELLRYGREIAVLRPIGVVHRMMDRVIVGAVLGPAAVSVVEIATQVATAADSVLSASSYAVTPTAAWLDARGERKKVADLLAHGTRVCVLVTLPFVIIPAVLAAPLVRVWISDAGPRTATLVVLALAYVAVTAPVQVGSNLLVGVGSARRVLWPALAAVVVNLGASLVLVGPLGVVGPFVATLIAAPVLVVPLWRASASYAGIAPAAVLAAGVAPAWRPALVMLVAVGGSAVVPMGDVAHLLVGGVVGLGAYAGAVFAFALSPAERAQVRSTSGITLRRLRR
jgi:O-antigen/teichoic acid export membrane protein